MNKMSADFITGVKKLFFYLHLGISSLGSLMTVLLSQKELLGIIWISIRKLLISSILKRLKLYVQADLTIELLLFIIMDLIDKKGCLGPMSKKSRFESS